MLRCVLYRRLHPRGRVNHQPGLILPGLISRGERGPFLCMGSGRGVGGGHFKHGGSLKGNQPVQTERRAGQWQQVWSKSMGCWMGCRPIRDHSPVVQASAGFLLQPFSMWGEIVRGISLHVHCTLQGRGAEMRSRLWVYLDRTLALQESLPWCFAPLQVNAMVSEKRAKAKAAILTKPMGLHSKLHLHELQSIPSSAR